MPDSSSCCLEPFKALTLSSAAVTPLAFFLKCKTEILSEIPKISPLPAFVHLKVYAMFIDAKTPGNLESKVRS